MLPHIQRSTLIFPRFHGHLYKEERDEIGGTNDHSCSAA